MPRATKKTKTRVDPNHGFAKRIHLRLSDTDVDPAYYGESDQDQFMAQVDDGEYVGIYERVSVKRVVKHIVLE